MSAVRNFAGDLPSATPLTGLSEAQAIHRLKADGYNELPSERRAGILGTAWEVIREPMLLLLVAAAVIYLLLGDLQEALLLIASISVVAGITLYQEEKTGRALEALRDLSSPRALVIRDGVERRIPGREVVQGDLVVLVEGDRVPADGIVVSSGGLSVDESLLTGESVPVQKTAAVSDRPPEHPGGDDLPFVYLGTLVVQGRAVARIQSTGAETELGRIGRSLATVVPEKTALQQETSRLVRRLAVLALVLCATAAVAYALSRHDLLGGLLAGIALAMAMIPEEFPIVLTVFLALGAARMAQKRVLTRRMPVLETLGAATTLCVDKTGTLTLNQMSVQALVAGTERIEVGSWPGALLPEMAQQVVEFGALASQADPFDPMERAILRLLPDTSRPWPLQKGWTLIREYPLTSALLAVVNVWRPSGERNYVVAAKGAPEAIGGLCRLSSQQQRSVLEQVGSMAQDGLRVLAVAKAVFGESELPDDQHAFDFELLGLIGLADPVRLGVPDSVRECRSAGIRVVMITGDYPATAQSIGRQIGLAAVDQVITGAELAALDDAALAARIKTVDIFARVVPEQKLRLVRALKAAGGVIAMTGDGVNDAPALKAADIGIAMGGRGTDVAREAASLVVLDDDFSSIVQAIRQGRRIFDNLKKASRFILAIHVPIAGISIAPLFFHLPLVLLPAHIVFLEMVIDPACSLVFEAEPEEATVMQRQPRDPTAPFFPGRLIAGSVLQGGGALAIILAVLLLSLRVGLSADEARAVTFTTLVIAMLAMIFADRSTSSSMIASLRAHNTPSVWVAAGAVLLLALVQLVPFLRHLFQFEPMDRIGLVLVLMGALAAALWFTAPKIASALGRPSRF